MLTLTLDPKKLSKGEASDRYIRECWRSMRVLLAKKYGKTVDFFQVLEFQKKTGMAHLHVLTNQYIEFEWIKKKWQNVGGGEHVDIRHIDVHRAVAYLTPYLAGEKIMHTLVHLPKRARIFTTSRSIVLWGKKEKSGGFLRRLELGSLYDAAPKPTNLRFEPIEDLKPFGLELLSSFESPPFQEAIGNRNVIAVLKAALPIWKAGTP
jgi:hypothetical protein